MKHIVIIGAGYGGVWSALSTARHLDLLAKTDEVKVTMINRDEYHGVRPRFYETELDQLRVPLRDVLEPIGVALVIGEVSEIDASNHKLQYLDQKSEPQTMTYDRLILAAGSHLFQPPVPGLAQYGFNVDTYHAAEKLFYHIENLPNKPAKGRYTAVVVGGGFTGVEASTNIADRLKRIAPADENPRVLVLDHNQIASTVGDQPQQVIQRVMGEMGIEMRPNTGVKAITEDHVELDCGEIIDTQTVVWTAGMRSSDLTQQFGVELDRYGRLPVNQKLQVEGVDDCFAAGDVAAAKPDSEHSALLSCQHAMPQGRVAGHNAVAALFGEPLVDYEQPWFITCFDLGSGGAIYAETWDSEVRDTKEAAKAIKLYINHDRIYPPLENGREGLLAAGEPVFKVIPLKVEDFQ
ncbi:MAG: FAD-dependent oxidoreductase [Coxiellaceae bacterium]|nr:FAD-dependent oxidoreductase [Coxiellaceae bacterium]